MTDYYTTTNKDYIQGYKAATQNILKLIRKKAKECLKLKIDIRKEWKELGNTKYYSNQYYAMEEVIFLMDAIEEKIKKEHAGGLGE